MSRSFVLRDFVFLAKRDGSYRCGFGRRAAVTLRVRVGRWTAHEDGVAEPIASSVGLRRLAETLVARWERDARDRRASILRSLAEWADESRSTP